MAMPCEHRPPHSRHPRHRRLLRGGVRVLRRDHRLRGRRRGDLGCAAGQRGPRHAGVPSRPASHGRGGGAGPVGERPVVFTGLGQHRAVDAVGPPQRTQWVRSGCPGWRRRRVPTAAWRRVSAIDESRRPAVAPSEEMANQPETSRHWPCRLITVFGSNDAQASVLPTEQPADGLRFGAGVREEVAGHVNCAGPVGGVLNWPPIIITVGSSGAGWW